MYEIVRGDTFTLPIVLNSGTKEYFSHYTLQDGEKLYVAISRPGQSFEEADIRIKLDSNSPRNSSGDVLLSILPYYTDNMYTGKYYLNIKYVDSEGNVTSIVNDMLFYISGTNPPDMPVSRVVF